MIRKRKPILLKTDGNMAKITHRGSSMKKSILVFYMILLPLLFGCNAMHSQKTITQISTIDALLAGVYDGQMS